MNSKQLRITLPEKVYEQLVEEQKRRKNTNGKKTALADLINEHLSKYFLSGQSEIEPIQHLVGNNAAETFNHKKLKEKSDHLAAYEARLKQKELKLKEHEKELDSWEENLRNEEHDLFTKQYKVLSMKDKILDDREKNQKVLIDNQLQEVKIETLQKTIETLQKTIELYKTNEANAKNQIENYMKMNVDLRNQNRELVNEQKELHRQFSTVLQRIEHNTKSNFFRDWAIPVLTLILAYKNNVPDQKIESHSQLKDYIEKNLEQFSPEERKFFMGMLKETTEEQTAQKPKQQEQKFEGLGGGIS
jgi:hypothetical protein